uniref:Thioredoxin domain-containing protein n=1 Tax=candidate division WOR-3 bacterium TaxID=2052148 RepID=A0A7C3URF9_UNCW3
MKGRLVKNIIIGLVLGAVVLVIFIKRSEKKKSILSNSPESTAPVPVESVLPKMKEIRNESPKESSIAKEIVQLKPSANILAVVNGKEIREEYLNKVFDLLPEEYKDAFKKDREGLLEQLIVRELLYQEAERKGLVDKRKENTDSEKRKEEAISRLIQNRAALVTVADEEIKRFYEERKADMGNARYEEVKENIRDFLRQEKQREVIDAYIESLKMRAEIKRNEKWLEEERKKNPPDPLASALKSGKPTVLDLGAGTCIPCKMMKPIFEELAKEYEGKANIILLEIGDYRPIANRLKVRVIPTQIFFDKDGNVYWRHEGFLPKEEIVKKLKEMGVE